jgi:hypothetical protein
MLTSVLAVAVLAALAPHGVALATAPSVTLSGAATDGTTPDGDRDRVTGVRATLSGGVAGGYLETEGKAGDVGGPYDGFSGTVSCMLVEGDQITVGALGSAWHLGEAEGAQREQLPGSYAQLLTVRFGDFFVLEPGESPVPSAFGLLGSDDQGIESSTPPDCSTASFTTPFPATNGALHVSPSITSPLDAAVLEGGSVTLNGSAERGAVVAVYDIAQPSAGAVTTTDTNGGWSATISGLAPGTHSFAAFVRPGSDIPSNVVRVEVIAAKAATTSSPGAGTPAPGPTTAQGVLALQEVSRVSAIPFARLATSSVSVTRSGALSIKISCPANETRCSGTVTLRTLSAFSTAGRGTGAGGSRGASALKLAAAPFTVAGGRVKSVPLRLSARGRALLAARQRLPARATILAHDPAGAVHTTQATVTLRRQTAR